MNDIQTSLMEYTIRAKQILKRTAQDIIELSQIAHEVREQVGYQEYVRWVKEDLGLSDQTGFNLLNVYKNFGSTQNFWVTDIAPSALYLLSAPSTPEPARQEAIERAEAGETISHKMAQEIAEFHKTIEQKNHAIKVLSKKYGDMLQMLPDAEEQEARIKALEAEIETARRAQPEQIEIFRAPDDYEDIKQAAADLERRLKEEIAQRNRMRQAYSEEIARLKAIDIAFPDSKYKTIVIDPPWPMAKVVRECRPNQAEFDYPTMPIKDIAAMPIGSLADEAGCHLFMWTTQKFLPDAIKVLSAWGFKYVLTMVWKKNGGFQPFGLPQYNCEFVIYGRTGTPEFLDTSGFFCCFDGDRREHSRKPDSFYNLVARVTSSPRIDVFSREPRDGFDQYGDETAKFSEAG